MMETAFIIAQASGLFAFLIGLYRLQAKHARTIILYDIPTSAFWSLHFFILGGYSGLIINILCIIRALAKYYLNHKNFIYAVIGVGVLIWLLCLYFYQNMYSILPPIASSIAAYGMIKDCRRQLTNCILIHNIFWFVYGVGIGSMFTCLTIIISTISCVIGKYRHERGISADMHKESTIKQPA